MKWSGSENRAARQDEQADQQLPGPLRGSALHKRWTNGQASLRHRIVRGGLRAVPFIDARSGASTALAAIAELATVAKIRAAALRGGRTRSSTAIARNKRKAVSALRLVTNTDQSAMATTAASNRAFNSSVVNAANAPGVPVSTRSGGLPYA